MQLQALYERLGPDGFEVLVFPCNRRLAMGSTHAADILMAITMLKSVLCSTLRSSLPGAVMTWLLWSGYEDNKPVARAVCG